MTVGHHLFYLFLNRSEYLKYSINYTKEIFKIENHSESQVCVCCCDG